MFKKLFKLLCLLNGVSYEDDEEKKRARIAAARAAQERAAREAESRDRGEIDRKGGV